MIENLTYFSKDKNFGDAAGMTIVDTTDWADSDFEFVEKVKTRVEDFPEFARLMSEWISGEMSPEDCVKIFSERFGIEPADLVDHYGDIIQQA